MDAGASIRPREIMKSSKLNSPEGWNAFWFALMNALYPDIPDAALSQSGLTIDAKIPLAR
jgi:hypothetical protein